MTKPWGGSAREEFWVNELPSWSGLSTSCVLRFARVTARSMQTCQNWMPNILYRYPSKNQYQTAFPISSFSNIQNSSSSRLSFALSVLYSLFKKKKQRKNQLSPQLRLNTIHLSRSKYINIVKLNNQPARNKLPNSWSFVRKKRKERKENESFGTEGNTWQNPRQSISSLCEC